jgi:hypothetical protein
LLERVPRRLSIKFHSFQNKRTYNNPFQVGMKLESVDLMDPKMICGRWYPASYNFKNEPDANKPLRL